MNTNEASTTVNAEVVNVIMKALYKKATTACEFVKPIARDQLSVVRLRAVVEAWAGDPVGGAGSDEWSLFLTGLFHYRIAAVGFSQSMSPFPNRARGLVFFILHVC